MKTNNFIFCCHTHSRSIKYIFRMIFLYFKPSLHSLWIRLFAHASKREVVKFTDGQFCEKYVKSSETMWKGYVIWVITFLSHLEIWCFLQLCIYYMFISILCINVSVLGNISQYNAGIERICLLFYIVLLQVPLCLVLMISVLLFIFFHRPIT
jgi:hypothetical protein